MRKLDDPRAAPLEALPGVELVAGDFDDGASIAAALVGVQRALLVSGAFSHDQFERETRFIEAAAAAGIEITVRIATASSLTKPGSKGAYGRAHHGIQTFINDMCYKVVDLNPNWSVGAHMCVCACVSAFVCACVSVCVCVCVCARHPIPCLRKQTMRVFLTAYLLLGCPFGGLL